MGIIAALKQLLAERRARRRWLADNPDLARGVREGWLTPPAHPGAGPPPSLPVATTEELLRQLDERIGRIDERCSHLAAGLNPSPSHALARAGPALSRKRERG